MKKRVIGGIAGFLLLLILVVNCPGPTSALVGDWKGTMEANDLKLRLLFDCQKGPDGKIQAKLLSPDQGTNEVPVDSVFLGFFTGKAKFQARSIRGQFAGKFKGNQITGAWRQGWQTFPLTLEKIDAAKFAAERTALPPASQGSSDVNEKTGGKLIGEWNGTLETPKKPLRVRITIVEQNGGLTGVLDSPDQGASHIPLTKLHMGRTDMIFDFDTIGGHLVANLDGSGNLAGQWDQRGKFYNLTLQKTQ